MVHLNMDGSGLVGGRQVDLGLESDIEEIDTVQGYGMHGEAHEVGSMGTEDLEVGMELVGYIDGGKVDRDEDESVVLEQPHYRCGKEDEDEDEDEGEEEDESGVLGWSHYRCWKEDEDEDEDQSVALGHLQYRCWKEDKDGDVDQSVALG
ncbi:hypothetical protein EMPS_06413 [Entomortierella parvispora]|uniref:Uncharacterized protein n=1 Tax=Entomortierella parvispora TaxID=205924 RepID=A0A9P3HC86_9FUNG|nr:hypothetical protein EMPS_06413 [Entomortierella parvispora]